MSYLSPAGIQVANGNMSSIANAATTAVQLIAAPGAGLMYIVHGVFLNVKVGTVTWTGVGNAWLVYGTTGNDTVNLASTFITNQIQTMSASTNYACFGPVSIGGDWLGSTQGQTQKVLSSATINKAIGFTCSNAVLTGNGTIDWKLWYSIIQAA